MRPRHTDRAPRIPTLLMLMGVLLLLCAVGFALQHAGADAGSWEGHAPSVVAGVDHASPGGSYTLASVEALDSDEAFPVASERLNALALGMFLVSLGLLLCAGLAGRGAQARLLDLLRLPARTPLVPARAPLSSLEVFRL